MANRFKIHPAIGIARVGDSPDEFYISPETGSTLPIACDPEGNPLFNPDGSEQTVSVFKDAEGRVKRQAARFRVFVYSDAPNSPGRELQMGDKVQVVKKLSGELLTGVVQNIQWMVYLANKKASWYQFQELEGEYGYPPAHALRNAHITDPNARQRLIIDPGPQTVSLNGQNGPQQAEFARGKNPNHPQSFPPPLRPYSVDTLGEIRATGQGHYQHLLVLGGYGHSGSMKTDYEDPIIRHYANNSGWFDDVSDGPVTAQIQLQVVEDDGRPVDPPTTLLVPVDVPAWVIVGYPRYVPQILDIITMEDVIYDLSVRQFAFNVHLYGVPPFDGTQKPPQTPEVLNIWRETAVWNTNYRPYFWRDIWPLLQRPNQYQWVMDFDPFTGGDPHNNTPGGSGNFDPDLISIPPHEGEDPTLRQTRAEWRLFLYQALRKPGQENLFDPAPNPRDPTSRLRGMPELCGDNPISNTAAAKFLRLTDTRLFLLKQWAEGKFINEKEENITFSVDPGEALDKGVLENVLGGAFCPGGEAAWIMRNPAIYAEPYRIKHRPVQDYAPGALSQPAVVSSENPFDLADGLEPGDLTKYSAQPWQADFNECSTEDIDITYQDWNVIYPQSLGDPAQSVIQTLFWWPAHRPMQVFLMENGPQADWTRGIPQNNAGDLMMVTAWKALGFILQTPDGEAFVEVERNQELE